MRRELEDRVEPHDHVNARSHHRRRVDQRADRRRAFHGVRQPDVERNLRRLAGGADKQEQSDRRHHRRAYVKVARGNGRANLVEIDRAKRYERQKQSQNKSGVAHAVDDKRLLARIRSRLAQEIKTDQQIAAQPHAFPAHEQEQHIVRQDQRQHREHEKVHIAEEPVVAALVRHIPGRVNVDQHPDAGDHHHHHRVQRVEHQSPSHVEIQQVPRRRMHPSGRHPVEQNHLHEAIFGRPRDQLQHRAARENKRRDHAANADHVYNSIRQPLAK